MSIAEAEDMKTPLRATLVALRIVALVGGSLAGSGCVAHERVVDVDHVHDHDHDHDDHGHDHDHDHDHDHH
jgi:ABC-type Zn2+ transport system substrate-binding protein/surface adhesin